MTETAAVISHVRGAGGVRLATQAWGRPADPPIVFLHGGGQTRFAWKGAAERFAAEGWYAVGVDLRGHGDSDWAPDGDYTLDAFAADVAAVCGTLDTRPAVVGASMGGLAALLAQGELEPPPASALVLVDIATRMDPGAVARIVTFMTAQPDGFASLEEAADAVARYQPHRSRPASVEGLRKNLRQGGDGRWRWHWDPAFMTSDRGPAAAGDAHRLDRAATRVAVPTLLVRGMLSDMVSDDAVSAFLDHVPHAVAVDVEDASHMVAGDRNDRFTDAVLSFLAGARTA